MEQIRVVGLDIAKSVSRLVQRPEAADNFTQRLVSPAGDQCLFLANFGCSDCRELRPLHTQLRTFDL